MSITTHESEEMYLETILLLKEKGKVRSVDIVEELNYAKSSVSRGVNLLADNGYITIDRQTGEIDFTEKGLEKAQGVYARHLCLKEILIEMGANEELAEESACRMEHVVSDELFDVLKSFVEKHKN